jgi:hypothetical protein
MTQKAESFPIGDHESRTRGKLSRYAQAPNHADSAGCSVSRRRPAGPRRCSRGRGHIGREQLSRRNCTSGGNGLSCVIGGSERSTRTGMPRARGRIHVRGRLPVAVGGGAGRKFHYFRNTISFRPSQGRTQPPSLRHYCTGKCRGAAIAPPRPVSAPCQHRLVAR